MGTFKTAYPERTIRYVFIDAFSSLSACYVLSICPEDIHHLIGVFDVHQKTIHGRVLIKSPNIGDL